jgi:hypothetical protein
MTRTSCKGETIMLGEGGQLHIVAIHPEIDSVLVAQVIDGVFVVEPV